MVTSNKHSPSSGRSISLRKCSRLPKDLSAFSLEDYTTSRRMVELRLAVAETIEALPSDLKRLSNELMHYTPQELLAKANNNQQRQSIEAGVKQLADIFAALIE